MVRPRNAHETSERAHDEETPDSRRGVVRKEQHIVLYERLKHKHAPKFPPHEPRSILSPILKLRGERGVGRRDIGGGLRFGEALGAGQLIFLLTLRYDGSRILRSGVLLR